MSKKTPGSNSHDAPALRNDKQRARAASPRPDVPVPGMSTQELIAKMWETLDWPRGLHLAVIITVSGLAAALVLTGLELATRTMTSQTAAWPICITITASVSYRIAHHRRRS